MEYLHLLNNILLVEELFSFVFLINMFMIGFNRLRSYANLLTKEQEEERNFANISAAVIVSFVLFIADIFRIILMLDFTVLINHPYPRHLYFFIFSLFEFVILLVLIICVVIIARPIIKNDNTWLKSKGKKYSKIISTLILIESILICMRFLVF